MPTIVHFDIPADDLERAKKFYSELFGWKVERPPGPPMEYYLVETEGPEGKAGPGGGIGKREAPDQRITNFIGVPSVEEYMAKVEELGGKGLRPKTAVPGWGYLAICEDTENNSFGLWEENKNAI